MRTIPLILSTILLTASAAPNPGSYSSARHYQFQRSSSSYRNNELQHKNEESGAYGRIEDPEKYDKPLEQSHYRQSSYNAPEDSDEDSSEEDYYPSQNVGIKGGHGHSGHNSYGHFGQGVIDSDYRTGDSFYQPGTYHHPHPSGFNYHSDNSGYSGNHYGHHNRDYHHRHNEHHHEYHHRPTQETSSQSSITTQNKDNKEDQLISLDQTFDYSKFKNEGFGKEYLDNTEGQRVTSPQSTTENIKPIFEATEAVPTQPGFSSQIGNNGQTTQVFTEAQTGQFGSTSQTDQAGISRDVNAVFGTNSQQGQVFPQQSGQSGTVFGQNSQQGQVFPQGGTVFGQNSQQGQVFTEDQMRTGQFASGSQIGQIGQDTQQQVDIGQSFLQGQTSQGSTSQIDQMDIGRDVDAVFGSNSQQGQVFRPDGTILGQNSQQGQVFRPDGTVLGQNSQQGQVFSEDQSRTGQFASGSQIGSQQGQSTIGQTFEGQSTVGQTFPSGQTFPGQSTVGQTFPGQTGQTIQQDDYLKPLFEQIDQIAAMDSRDHTGSATNQFNSGSSYPIPQSGRNYNYNHREIIHHTTGYIKPKYEPHFTHHHEPGVDEPDCQHHKKIEKPLEEKVEEKPAEEMTTQEIIQEATTQESFQEATTEEAIREDNNMEIMNQEKQEEMSGGNLEPMTVKVETTTAYYKYHGYDKKYEQEHEQEEDLTQQTQHFDQHSDDRHWHEGVQLHQNFGKFDYDGQQEDLTQQTQDDLTQQTQDAFGRIEFGGKDFTQQHEDLSQKQQGPNEEYGHLEFGQQQEDLSQKQEDLSQKQEDLTQKQEDHHGYGNGYIDSYGNSYGSNGYRNSHGFSTASSRSFSISSSSRSSYGSSHNIQSGGLTQDLTQNKEKEQFATEVQDVSQQVQKVENLNLEEQKETPFEQEEIAVVAEEKPTEKPGFWKRLGGSITRTYETAKEKVKNNLG